MENLIIALQNVFMIQNLIYVIIGVLSGIIVGAIPGMTSVMLLAILLPFTFHMEASGAIILMISIVSGANYAGGISAILLNMPGTPSAAATALDGFPMCQNGKGGMALIADIFASFIGGTIAWIIMIIATPLVTKFALMFGPTEYTMLLVFSLTIIGMLAGEDPLKGILAGIFGLALSTIGTDPYSARIRYTFGFLELMDGIEIIWASIGIFALVQVLKFVKQKDRAISIDTKKKIDWPIKETLKIVLSKKSLLIRSTLIGTFIGAAPGAGPAIASFVSYGEAKRNSKNHKNFGKGEIEGVIASEAANNACGFGSLVPMLSLGIPGSTSAALAMAAMIIVGLQPGPELFSKNITVVYTIFGGIFLSNIVFLFFGLFFARFTAKLLIIKVSYLIPVIMLMATIGVYSPKRSIFGVFVTFIICIVGYMLIKFGFPLTPIMLGLILGKIMESHFIRAMIMTKKNMLQICLYSPLSIILTIATILSVIYIIRNYFKKSL